MSSNVSLHPPFPCTVEKGSITVEESGLSSPVHYHIGGLDFHPTIYSRGDDGM